ncbi:hypothetical protein [Candidatus Nanohalococcus occultus]|uniref:Uncharacterized protein n=1 Tax=Candidatus Nanohalococcus occultus TaxID=2978047 RepID=A0ABY8CEE4_9ARCH|nr:hypothetical protein SVXNc_0577 [Candidatus Nanohaloarchaeota archaeon SVXNc]
MEGFEIEEFENLRKVVETIEGMVEEGYLQAPTLDEIAEELGVSDTTVSKWSGGSYNHAVRTAGLIPNKNLNAGDYMAVYSELDEAGGKITKKAFEQNAPIGSLSKHRNKDLTHNQAREKLGLEPNQGFEHYVGGKFYGDDGENLEDRIRGLEHDFLELESRPPSNDELYNKISFRERSRLPELRARTGVHAEPVTIQGRGRMAGEREDEVFDFWVREYLEEDWSQYSDADVDTVMKLRMAREDISESELSAVAAHYGKWLDLDQY